VLRSLLDRRRHLRSRPHPRAGAEKPPVTDAAALPAGRSRAVSQ
jgi:hypothetical protein